MKISPGIHRRLLQCGSRLSKLERAWCGLTYNGAEEDSKKGKPHGSQAALCDSSVAACRLSRATTVAGVAFCDQKPPRSAGRLASTSATEHHRRQAPADDEAEERHADHER